MDYPSWMHLSQYASTYFRLRISLDLIFKKVSGFVTYGIKVDYQKFDMSSCWRRGHEDQWFYPTTDKVPEVGTRNQPV